jgi:glycine hydroxymethyltransferase
VVTTTTHKTLRGPRGGLVLCSADLAPAVDRGCPLVLGGPLPHVMAAKAVALQEASRPEFSTYARAVVDNARTLADRLQAIGVGVLTGGTDNHLVMVDLRGFGLTGRIAEAALVDAGVTCNRNPVPGDPQGAWYTSGLRLGTPAVTTLGMGADEMGQIADVIHGVLAATTPATIASGPNAGRPSRVNYTLDDSVLSKARASVDELLGRHRLYPGINL